MKKGLWAKFVQPDGKPTALGKKLIATGNWPLIEGNKRAGKSDEFWGMEFDFTGGHNNVKLSGENKLGMLLMEIRAYLQSQS